MESEGQLFQVVRPPEIVGLKVRTGGIKFEGRTESIAKV